MGNLRYGYRHFFRFGKCIGLLARKNPKKAFYIRCIPYIFISNVIVDFIGLFRMPWKNASSFGWNLGSPLFYFMATFTYFYFHRNQHYLRNIFVLWNKPIPIRNLQYNYMKQSVKKTNVIAACLLTSAVLENAVFHLKLFPIANPTQQQLSSEAHLNLTALETYYLRSHKYWYDLIPYNPFLACFLFLTNKLALYAWNYSDVFVIVVNETISCTIKAFFENSKDDTNYWNSYWDNFQTILNLVCQLSENLSPLIFVSFVMNIYATCMQMHLFLTPAENSNPMYTAYSLWAFGHLVTRLSLVTLSSAKVHRYMEKCVLKVQDCPMHTFNENFKIKRVETTNIPALHGLHCFRVTRKFILSLGLILFNIEVFLLQSDITSNVNK